MKKILSLCLLTVLILTVFTCCKNKEADVKKYDELKEGMSYAEAVEVMGSEGEKVHETRIDEYTTVIYNWEGKNNAYVSATFINDKLTIMEKYNFD